LPRRGGRRPFLEIEALPLGGGLGAAEVRRLAEEGGRLERREIHAQAGGVEPRTGEQLLDHLGEAGGLLQHPADRVAVLRGRPLSL
jgi:hypothetical protein